MGKRLPYFQFEPAEYITKDIQFCTLAAQGLFINICAIYWQRECRMTKDQLFRKFNEHDLLDELIDEKIITFFGDKLRIDFLDIQYNEAIEKSERNSINGRKGGRPKNPNKSETKAKQNPNETQTKGNKIKEDNIREDNIKENNIPAFDVFFDYAKSKEPRINKKDLLFKYDSWVENGWKDGNDRKVKNWKSKLLNTIPHLKKDPAPLYKKLPPAPADFKN